MKKITSVIFILLLAITVFACDENNDITDLERYEITPDEVKDCEMQELSNGYKIVWCDEFNYTGAVDSTKWNYDLGGSGWGNGESQYYTSRQENSYVENGYLTIKAIKENYNGCNYTSARLTTKAKADFKYGFVEVRAKLPEGVGTWPAIWMLPSENVYGIWPNSGEIDIMEAVGKSPNVVLGTIHTGSFNHMLGTQKGSSKSVRNASSTFNLYQLEWDEDSIKIYVNGNLYFTFNNSDAWKEAEKGYMLWPFDQKFHLILNIAMGGSLGGNIDPNFTEAEMVIDYVRVYQKSNEGDNEAPSSPEVTNVYTTGSTINIDWNNATDNYGVRYYEIYLNKKLIGATFKNTYTITGLDPNKTYYVLIAAVDWCDNYSLSDNIQAKTKGNITIPGEIPILGYSSQEGTSIIEGSVGNKVLKMIGLSSIDYSFTNNTVLNYSMTVNVSVLKTSNLKIYLQKDGNKILINEVSLNPSYGKYKDIVLFENVLIENGDYILTIECNSNTQEALLLNKITVSN